MTTTFIIMTLPIRIDLDRELFATVSVIIPPNSVGKIPIATQKKIVIVIVEHGSL